MTEIPNCPYCNSGSDRKKITWVTESKNNNLWGKKQGHYRINGVIKRGFYKVKDSKERRWYCNLCKKHFTSSRLRLDYRSRYDEKKILYILQLYKTKKLSVNKYDSHKKETYSIRDIAKLLNITHGGVFRILKAKKELLNRI